MNIEANNRLMLLGFLLLYFGAMGTLVAIGVGDYGVLAIEFMMGPAAVIGTGVIAIAKLLVVESGTSDAD